MPPLSRGRRGRALGPASLAVLAALALGGCQTAVAPTAAHVTEPGHNHADLAFTSEMVTHHEQGLRLVAMVGERDLRPEVAELIDRIGAEQADDIVEMEAWLTAWGEGPSARPTPTPNPVTDESAMSTSATTGAMRGLVRTRMGPWALGAEELRNLDACRSAHFEDHWLRTMITHHQGAISMARHEIAGGMYPATITLAEHLITIQQAEIELMRQLLRD